MAIGNFIIILISVSDGQVCLPKEISLRICDVMSPQINLNMINMCPLPAHLHVV